MVLYYECCTSFFYGNGVKNDLVDIVLLKDIFKVLHVVDA